MSKKALHSLTQQQPYENLQEEAKHLVCTAASTAALGPLLFVAQEQSLPCLV